MITKEELRQALKFKEEFGLRKRWFEFIIPNSSFQLAREGAISVFKELESKRGKKQ
jgi:hypothetical protein